MAKRKRPMLLDDEMAELLPRYRRSRTVKPAALLPPPLDLPEGGREAGRLFGHQTTIVVVTETLPLTIGRSPSADLTLSGASVSAWHCFIFAFESDAGECLACLEDASTHGIRWNGKLVKRSKVILSDGDCIEIGRHKFTYKHTATLGQPYDPESSPFKSSPTRPFTLDRYVVSGRILGTGFFSSVHLAFDMRAQSQVAVKIVKKRKSTGGASSAKGLVSDIELNAKLSHPNVNRILEVKEDVEHLYLFMDLQTGGDLFSYIQRRGTLDGAAAKWIIFSVLLGLQYMHDVVGISHRDLKPENILLGSATDRFPRVVLADFGAARMAEKKTASFCGTISYMAPEVLTVALTGSYSSKKADMWAVGLLTFITFTGSHPFNVAVDSTSSVLARQTSSVFSRLRIGTPSPEDVGLVKNVLDHVPQRPFRLHFPAFADPLRRPQDFTTRLLEPSPDRRMSAAEALGHAWIKGSRKELDALYDLVMGRQAR